MKIFTLWRDVTDLMKNLLHFLQQENAKEILIETV